MQSVCGLRSRVLRVHVFIIAPVPTRGASTDRERGGSARFHSLCCPWILRIPNSVSRVPECDGIAVRSRIHNEKKALAAMQIVAVVAAWEAERPLLRPSRRRRGTSSVTVADKGRQSVPQNRGYSNY